MYYSDIEVVNRSGDTISNLELRTRRSAPLAPSNHRVELAGQRRHVAIATTGAVATADLVAGIANAYLAEN
jgi:hypothetical protein